jgi:hypothetical protein
MDNKMANVGYSGRADVLVNRTADGVDLNAIFAEIQDANAVYNEHVNSLAALLSFRTTDTGAAVPQSGWAVEEFEESTEYGIPQKIGVDTALKLGYTFKDWDLALGATWKWVRDASAAEVTAKVQRVYEADTKLVVTSVFNRVLDPRTFTNDWGLPCYGLLNNDGMKMPDYMGQKFTGTEDHYLTTGSATLDAADVEQAARLIKRFGYGVEDSSKIILLASPNTIEASGLAGWRAGQEHATGKKAKYDFVPSSNAPAYLTNLEIRGAVPPADYAGLPVVGSYGGILVIESHFMYNDRAIVFATGGPGSEKNVVGMREHQQSQYAGLRQIPGNQTGYPLLDSYFQRSFGVGVRHRGAAVALEITEGADYIWSLD